MNVFFIPPKTLVVIVVFCRSVFFGDVSPKDKPGFYIQCIYNVYQTYADKYRNKVPLIINTQGWVKGELFKQQSALSLRYKVKRFSL